MEMNIVKRLIELKRNRNTKAIMVLLIAEIEKNNGASIITHREIGEIIGIKRDSVKANIDKLKKWGLIKVGYVMQKENIEAEGADLNFTMLKNRITLTERGEQLKETLK